MRLLLDTCTFLWIVADAPELSAAARAMFLDPGNDVFLSPVSGWEVCVKWSLGKLPLPEPPEKFVAQQRRNHGITTLPLRERAALHLPALPGLHKDPFDRMLICQAHAEGLSILTPDPLIRAYAVPTHW